VFGKFFDADGIPNRSNRGGAEQCFLRRSPERSEDCRSKAMQSIVCAATTKSGAVWDPAALTGDFRQKIYPQNTRPKIFQTRPNIQIGEVGEKV